MFETHFLQIAMLKFYLIYKTFYIKIKDIYSDIK